VPSVDDLAQLCFALARDEVTEIMGGEDHITMDDLTACEMVALLTILRPVRVRRRRPAPVLTLVPRRQGGWCMTGSLDPRPGWVRRRTHELHKSGLSWIDAREQAVADDEFGSEENGPGRDND